MGPLTAAAARNLVSGDHARPMAWSGTAACHTGRSLFSDLPNRFRRGIGKVRGETGEPRARGRGGIVWPHPRILGRRSGTGEDVSSGAKLLKVSRGVLLAVQKPGNNIAGEEC